MAVKDGIYVSLRQMDEVLEQYLPALGFPSQALPQAIADLNSMALEKLSEKQHLVSDSKV